MTIELKPHERAALIVAWSQVKRGEFPMPACATVCVAALARLTELDGPDDAPEMQPTLNAITTILNC